MTILTRLSKAVEGTTFVGTIVIMLCWIVLATQAGAAEATRAAPLLAEKKWDEAVLVLREELQGSPRNIPAVLDLATALTRLNRRSEAIAELIRASESGIGSQLRNDLRRRASIIGRSFYSSETFQVHQDGLVLFQSGQFSEAAKKFEEALKAEPDHVEILVRFSQASILSGNPKAALEPLRTAIRLSPDESEVALWLGRALHDLGQWKDAEPLLFRARRGLGRSENAPVWYAEALVSLGKSRVALNALEEDMKRQPFHLASILEWAKIRMAIEGGSKESLWDVRKRLQVALSRLSEYEAAKRTGFESELGWSVFPVNSVRRDLERQAALLDSRLGEGTSRRE